MLLLKKTLIILLGIIITSCSDTNDTPSNNALELIASYDVNVLEPSGLAVNSNGTVLYTVSDNTAKVYKLSLTGNVLQTFSYEGEDLEGVSSYTNNKLLLAEERSKEIVEFNMITNTVIKHRINYQNNSENSGIEGVAFNQNDQTIFILNEKDPGKLIRLRNDFSVIAEYNLSFAADYSGIFYDVDSNLLWIVSDQNSTLNKCTLMGELIEKYSFNITQAEGVVITNNKIYIISDALERLYVFNKPE
ncbi:MAG: SdiA-regulated domain-containing protein [Flavobacteriaceae bacterium]